MGVVPIERMVAIFQGASGWPAARRIEAAVNDGPPDAVAPIMPLAAIVARGRSRRGDFLQLRSRTLIRRFWTIGRLHRDTIPNPKGRQQARCVIICAREALYFCLMLFTSRHPFHTACPKLRRFHPL